MNEEEIRNLREELDDITRLISDIQIILTFKEELASRDSVVDLIQFRNGESIHMKLEPSDVEAVDTKIDVMVSAVRKKLSSITRTH